jgi:F0F1-type ATP synthase membrane subunit b/b'
MKAIAIYSFMFIAFSATAFAEEAIHSEPSIKELMYPAINFFVLVAFLVWKLKKPTIEMFNKKADDVQSLMFSAAQKNKDAEEKLKVLQGKLSNLPAELSKIKKDYEHDVVAFTEAQSVETQSTIVRTKKDLEHKLDGEKNEMVETLNEDLLKSVIAITQQTINGSSDMKKRATSNIVSELR